MGKTKKLFLFTGIICLVLTLCYESEFSGVSNAAAAPIKLVIANWEPPQGTGSGPLKEWLKELETKSDGRIKGGISFGAMGPPPKYYELAVKGIAHVTLIAPPYTPGRFPMSEVMQLPVTGEMSSETFAKAYWELFKKGYFDKEFKDVKVLYLGGMCPYDLQMSKGKDIRRFSDMKGKKLRASGALHTRIIKAFGAIPVGMPAPEIPIAMQKGTIDGQFQHLGFVKAFRTEEITRSVTKIGVSSLTFAVVMNKKVYEKMPSDIKAIIDEMGPKYSALFGRAHDKMAEASGGMLKNAGAVFYDLPATDMTEIGGIVAPLWEQWISEKEAKGMPGKKIVTDLYETFKGMGVRNPFHGYRP
jgi:TRAP-type C4-dicarboxylate transport system substrate-binding protein